MSPPIPKYKIVPDFELEENDELYKIPLQIIIKNGACREFWPLKSVHFETATSWGFVGLYPVCPI